MDFSLAEVVFAAIPIVLAITVHEAAHGYVARMFGDQTAWMLGRVTLNPIKHIDPVGTILVPGMLLLLARLSSAPPFIFGWAKPVPVNFANLRNPKKDMFWVAGAGPFANFVMAIGWALLLKDSSPDGVFASESLAKMGGYGVQSNLMLLALNLLPILPLDGGRIAVSLLPRNIASSYARLEPYGFMLVIILLATGILSQLMQPIYQVAESVVAAIVGL